MGLELEAVGQGDLLLWRSFSSVVSIFSWGLLLTGSVHDHFSSLLSGILSLSIWIVRLAQARVSNRSRASSRSLIAFNLLIDAFVH